MPNELVEENLTKTDADPNTFVLNTDCSSAEDDHSSDDDAEIDIFKFYGIDNSKNENKNVNCHEDIKADIEENEGDYFDSNEETDEDLGKHKFDKSV